MSSKGKAPRRPPVTAGQLADRVNGMSRKDRLSFAEDLENIAKGAAAFREVGSKMKRRRRSHRKRNRQRLASHPRRLGR